MAPQPPARKVDPALRPMLDGGSGGVDGLSGAHGDVVAEWLEHIRTGRIEVR